MRPLTVAGEGIIGCVRGLLALARRQSGRTLGSANHCFCLWRDTDEHAIVLYLEGDTPVGFSAQAQLLATPVEPIGHSCDANIRKDERRPPRRLLAKHPARGNDGGFADFESPPAHLPAF